MGAKTPEQVKKSSKLHPLPKCDVCGRKFLKNSAMISHYKTHMKSDGPKFLKKQEFPGRKPAPKPAKKKMIPIPVSLLKRVNLNPPESNETETTTESEKPAELAVKSPSVTRKAEFECPICADKFPVYFTAFRHIQKNHCVDSTGEQVAPNSPHLVKPVRIETCASCKQQIRSTIPHDCPKMQVYKDQYTCLGCNQIFQSLVLFQQHVKGIHADGSLNYFFSNRNDFESWKAELQDVINTEFIKLNKQKSKEIYHCSYQPPNSTTATRLCPASIFIREYLRGIHVCYYKEHVGHIIKKDVDILLKNYRQYSISLRSKESKETKLDDVEDNNLYVQFKDIMKSIITDAAKVDGGTLNDLFGRALEMTSVLKNHHEDSSIPVVNKSLSDDQISKSLDSLKPKQQKRKQNLEGLEIKNVVVKKVKRTPSSVENGLSTRVSRSTAALSKSVTFNKEPKKNEETSDTDKQTSKKDIQETPQRGLRKKTEEQPLKSALKKAEQLQTDEVQKPDEPSTPVVRSQLQSPSSFNDSYKNFVDLNFKCATDTSTPKAKVNVKKKEVVKTKIGQFKPGSPKSPKSPKEVDKEVYVTPTFKVKPDIEYIVKERENDCNILILKI